MNAATLHMAATTYDALLKHLLKGKNEEAAFAFSRIDRAQEWHVEAIQPVPRDGFSYQSPVHIELTEDTLAAAIKDAWDQRAMLVEFHSHPGTYGTRAGMKSEVEFSSSDIAGFEEWVPHVLWRLRDKPYLAIVVGHSSVDALAWYPGDQLPHALHSIVLDDGRVIKPTAHTLRYLTKAGWSL